jgi:hypothetical protein
MSFDNWGEADDQNLRINLGGFDTDDGAADAFTTSFEESLNAGPTLAVSRFVGSVFAEENLTGAEANEKYNLAGTGIEYKDDERVSDFEARVAADRHYEKMINNATLQNATESGLGTVASFAGSLAGGFVDPVNIAVGVGFASAVKGANAVQSLYKAMNISAKTRPFTESLIRNGLENIASTAAVDLALIPLGETVTREEVSGYQRTMNIVGGALFGTVLGVRLLKY